MIKFSMEYNKSFSEAEMEKKLFGLDAWVCGLQTIFLIVLDIYVSINNTSLL